MDSSHLIQRGLNLAPLMTFSKYHGTVEYGGDLWRLSTSTPCSDKGQLEPTQVFNISKGRDSSLWATCASAHCKKKKPKLYLCLSRISNGSQWKVMGLNTFENTSDHLPAA